jgi:nucleoside-diphosphate-sugar epimerase
VKKTFNQSVAASKPWQTSRIGGAKLAIVGCGDVGLRLLRLVSPKIKTLALGRSPINTAEMSHARFATLDLDGDFQRLKRYCALAPWVVYLAPPPAEGLDDPRMKHFLAAAQRRSNRAPKKIIYVSTTGVYGTANGAWVSETSARLATEPRPKRRIAAEHRLHHSRIKHTSVLRAPGIYADDRLPLKRLQDGLPAFIETDDVPTNHIHADDLARLCWLGLFQSRNRRCYNAADGQPMMHAQYLKAVATHFNLPQPPQLPRAEVQAALRPIAWSMLSSARRINSQRLLQEWRVTLKYPSMADFLQTLY